MGQRAARLWFVAAAVLVLGVVGFWLTRVTELPEIASTTTSSAQVTATSSAVLAPTSTVPPETTTTAGALVREPGTVPAWTVGVPWGSTIGLTMFRGNPTRSFYGTGPVPEAPEILWTYPDSPMCRSSSSGGETKVWCGLGWTGQPVVWERPDGVTEVIFGAYDGAVHFVDAETGRDLRPPFPTGDIIKGSVTLDPDGYPLLYFGSRDNKLRIVALDREVPEMLWSLDSAEVPGIWNNDWDSNPVIVDDIMYEGGENGWFYAIGLNREYLDGGLVTVAPEILFEMPGYNEELLANSGRNVSIEMSVAVFEKRVYFANSGGRIVGLDVSRVTQGEVPVVFDYYAGGDIDATMVVDAEGMLYVSIEHEPSEMGPAELDRNREVGQLVKLDPYASGDPRVWGLDLTAGPVDAGSWATPAIHGSVVYLNTHLGELLAVDAETGAVLWSDDVGYHSWSSPAVVDGTLITATCLGDVRAYSLADPRAPSLQWSVDLGGACLEATPAIWDGRIFIGSRDGFLRALG